eukprot:3423491-Rhodomonas_salina.1
MPLPGYAYPGYPGTNGDCHQNVIVYPGTPGSSPLATNERRSSLPAVPASKAASSEGLRSILSHTTGIAAS